MTRRSLREYTFFLLFQKDFYPPEELEAQIELYFSLPGNENLSKEEKKEIKARVISAAKKAEEFDQKIDEVAEGWKSNRMGRVDLTILRLALFELLYDEEVPQGVAINEAVELAKKFGGDDSPAFVNGILAKFAQPQGC